MEVLIVIIVAIVLLVIYYLVAREFYRIAVMKGHDQKKYLWLSFWLTFVGWFLVIALPDRKKYESQVIIKENALNALSDELPDL